MPWTPSDVDRHYGGLTDKQKRQWCHVANGALERGDDEGVAIRKASGAVNNSKMEAVIYTKLADYMNTVRLQEAARFWESLLNEADPYPRVEKDIKGDPVVPTETQYAEYFQSMSAANIEKMLAKTRARWEAAADDAEDIKAKADKQAMELELKVGAEILKHKEAEEAAFRDVAPSAEVTEPVITTVIRSIMGMMRGI